MDEFISLVAHDLRTPLTAIKGYAQLVLRQRRDQPPGDPIAESMRTIIAQADRLDEMTASLLDISRVRVGRVPLRRSRVDVRAIAQNVFLELPEVAAELAPPVDAPPDPGESIVDADPARVGQVLRTMTTYLATREGRGALSARLTTSGGDVTIAVLDDGQALAADAAQRLFDRLIQPALLSPTGWQIAHPDLYVARGLAAAHGGTLDVDSPVDGSENGVRLTLTLPLAGGRS